jgi:hypothetical protein
VAAIRWTHSLSLGAIRARFTSLDLTPKRQPERRF